MEKSPGEGIADDDDWSQLSDRASRRRIQNRLSQRRRRRLQKEKATQQQVEAEPPTADHPEHAAPDPGASLQPDTELGCAGSPTAHSTTAIDDPPRTPATLIDQLDPETLWPDGFLRSHQASLDDAAEFIDLKYYDGLNQEIFSVGEIRMPSARQEKGCEKSRTHRSPCLPEIHDPNVNHDMDGLCFPVTSDAVPRPFSPRQYLLDLCNCCGRDHSEQSTTQGLSNQGDHKPYGKLSLDRKRPAGETASSVSMDGIPTVRGSTSLHLAVRSDHIPIVRLLLESGLDPDSKDTDGRSPLHLATTSGNQVLVHMLLEHGAGPDLCDQCGRTPLHYAAMGGDARTARVLLQYGADAHICDSTGYNGLHLAVVGGHEEVVRLLLQRGVDMRSRVAL